MLSSQMQRVTKHPFSSLINPADGHRLGVGIFVGATTLASGTRGRPPQQTGLELCPGQRHVGQVAVMAAFPLVQALVKAFLMGGLFGPFPYLFPLLAAGPASEIGL